MRFLNRWFDKQMLLKFNEKAKGINCLKDRVFTNSSQWCKGQSGYTMLTYFVNFHDLVPENIGLIRDGAAESCVRHYLKLSG